MLNKWKVTEINDELRNSPERNSITRVRYIIHAAYMVLLNVDTPGISARAHLMCYIYTIMAHKKRIMYCMIPTKSGKIDFLHKQKTAHSIISIFFCSVMFLDITALCVSLVFIVRRWYEKCSHHKKVCWRLIFLNLSFGHIRPTINNYIYVLYMC